MGSVGARRFDFKNRDGTEVTFGFFTFNITHHSNNERSELQFQYDDAVNQVGMMKLKQEHIPVRTPDLITLIYSDGNNKAGHRAYIAVFDLIIAQCSGPSCPGGAV